MDLLSSSGNYHYLSRSNMDDLSIEEYIAINATVLPLQLYIVSDDGSPHRIGHLESNKRLLLKLRPGQLIFNNLSPEVYEVGPYLRNIVINTIKGESNDNHITIAGFDGPSALTLHNHFNFPIRVEFEACQTPLSCRRLCDGKRSYTTRSYEITGNTERYLNPPSITIQGMDGSLSPTTEMRLYRSDTLLYKFQLNDPRILPTFSNGDVRQLKELHIGVTLASYQ